MAILEQNAKLLFGAENPPGKDYVSGSQDHIGLLFPGVNRLITTEATGPRGLNLLLKKKPVNGYLTSSTLFLFEPPPEGYDPLKEIEP